MAADLVPFFEDGDRHFELAGRKLRVVLPDQPGEVVGPCQARRSGADEEHVDLQSFSFLVAHATGSSAVRPFSSAGMLPWRQLRPVMGGLQSIHRRRTYSLPMSGNRNMIAEPATSATALRFQLRLLAHPQAGNGS